MVQAYAQSLRVIGQALETLNVRNFEIENQGDDFVIRGTASQISGGVGEPPRPHTALQFVWGLLPGHPAPASRGEPEAFTRLDLRYTAADLERLENEGRSRRDHGERPADASSLSQVLRAIGGYIEHKRCRLLSVLRRGNAFEVQYQTPAGQLEQETLSGAALYDFWVRMYMRRANRGCA